MSVSSLWCSACSLVLIVRYDARQATRVCATCGAPLEESTYQNGFFKGYVDRGTGTEHACLELLVLGALRKATNSVTKVVTPVTTNTDG